MYIADTLSRAFISNEETQPAFHDFENINMVETLAVSADRLKDITEEPAKDKTLQRFEKTIKEGYSRI